MQSVEEQIAAKGVAIHELIFNNAKRVVKLVCELNALTKKQPRIKSKRTNYNARLKVKKRAWFIRASLAINQLMMSVGLQKILSQPIPKFKPGGMPIDGPAIVGEQGIEMIVDTKGNIIPIKHNEETNKIYNPNNKSNESE